MTESSKQSEELPGENPDRRALILYHIAADIHREIMRTGVQNIVPLLTDSEKLCLDLYHLVCATPGFELPLFLTGLRIQGNSASVSLPSDIIAAKDMGTLKNGVERLIYCYNTLSPECFSEQMYQLLGRLQSKVIDDLISVIKDFGFELPSALHHKLTILCQKMKEEERISYEFGLQPDIAFEGLRDLVMKTHGMSSATDGVSAFRNFTELSQLLARIPSIERELTGYAMGNLTDCVLAALCAEIEEYGFLPPEITTAKMMLYYAIRFSLSDGQLAFWTTSAYRALMKQVGI